MPHSSVPSVTVDPMSPYERTASLLVVHERRRAGHEIEIVARCSTLPREFVARDTTRDSGELALA